MPLGSHTTSYSRGTIKGKVDLPSGDALYETLLLACFSVRVRKLANAALTEVSTRRESPRLELPHQVEKVASLGIGYSPRLSISPSPLCRRLAIIVVPRTANSQL
ncbi:MAG: hypothetical protein V7K47_16920 [Nostoc sp.]